MVRLCGPVRPKLHSLTLPTSNLSQYNFFFFKIAAFSTHPVRVRKIFSLSCMLIVIKLASKFLARKTDLKMVRKRSHEVSIYRQSMKTYYSLRLSFGFLNYNLKIVQRVVVSDCKIRFLFLSPPQDRASAL